MATEIEIAWAAGLFEGEGCFTQGKRPGRLPAPQMAMKSTDEDVLRRFHAIVEVGSITGPHLVEARKPYWFWRHNGFTGTNKVVKMFLPYLGERRRARAIEVLWANIGPTVTV